MDREKVIKGLEFTKAMITFNPSTGKNIEPWNLNEANKTTYDACVSAIAMLKEQEAKPPAIMQDVEGIWSTCSICGHKLRAILAMKMDTYFPKFCSECGQAVKWE